MTGNLPVTPLPRHQDAVDRGLSHLNAGRLAEALQVLGRESRNNRLDVDAQLNYGVALYRARHYEPALEQFERASRLAPRRWQIYQNIGAVYHGLRRYEEAYTSTLESVRINPDNASGLYHLGDMSLIWGEIPEAVDWYRRALDVDPDHFDAWIGLLFGLDLLPETTGEQALAERRAFAHQFERALGRFKRPHINDRDPDRKLRIGYISGDFRDHTAAYMFGPIYDHHDRDQFEVYSYADLYFEDTVGEWFKSASNGWRSIHDVPPQQVDRMIRADQIDILIDTAGYTSGGKLLQFCAKPAPIQIQAWGYLTGSGLDAMDAILVDDVLMPPEHEHHFTEKPLRVPYALGFAFKDEYAVPILPRPEGRPLTFGHRGRSDKISDAAVDLWADVLKAHPGSRMVMKDRGLEQPRTQARIVQSFTDRGVSEDRLTLLGRTDRVPHLAAYNDVDVILDSVPQGGGTTTMEALFMGTPVLTMLGPRITSRIAGTTLSALGRSDWIATDRDDFIRRAGSLADQGGPHIRDAFTASIVCDGAARTRAFENAVRNLWRQWCQRQKE